jgi:hypothetical protein
VGLVSSSAVVRGGCPRPGPGRRCDDHDVLRDLLVLVASLLALGLLVAAATLAPWLVVLVGPPVLITRSLLDRAHDAPR